MGDLILRFFKNDSGVTAIEYGLIAALLGLVLIATLMSTVGPALSGTFMTVASAISGA
jgi:pilus assembly protein Flp/PilA